MKKSKKHYKQRFNDFCAIAWLRINTNFNRAQALQKGMQDAIMNPLEDTTKLKKNDESKEEALGVSV